MPQLEFGGTPLDHSPLPVTLYNPAFGRKGLNVTIDQSIDDLKTEVAPEERTYLSHLLYVVGKLSPLVLSPSGLSTGDYCFVD